MQRDPVGELDWDANIVAYTVIQLLLKYFIVTRGVLREIASQPLVGLVHGAHEATLIGALVLV